MLAPFASHAIAHSRRLRVIFDRAGSDRTFAHFGNAPKADSPGINLPCATGPRAESGAKKSTCHSEAPAKAKSVAPVAHRHRAPFSRAAQAKSALTLPRTPETENPLTRPNWSRPLPRSLVIPEVMTLVTLTDVRELIEGHLPAHFRDKATWRVRGEGFEGSDPRRRSGRSLDRAAHGPLA